MYICKPIDVMMPQCRQHDGNGVSERNKPYSNQILGFYVQYNKRKII